MLGLVSLEITQPIDVQRESQLAVEQVSSVIEKVTYRYYTP